MSCLGTFVSQLLLTCVGWNISLPVTFAYIWNFLKYSLYFFEVFLVFEKIEVLKPKIIFQFEFLFVFNLRTKNTLAAAGVL